MDELQKSDRDEKKVQEYMATTYASQRLCLNSATGSLKDVRENWGFLFVKKMLVEHCETLLNVKLTEIY